MSSDVAFLPWKNQRAAMSGPAKDATPWKPWLKLRRAAAYLGLPSTEMYEFAATSRHESPHPVHRVCQFPEFGILEEGLYAPMTKVQPTNPPYAANLADGQKKMAPGHHAACQ